MTGDAKNGLPEPIEDETLDMVVGGAIAPVPSKGFKVEIEGVKAIPGDGSVKPIAQGSGGNGI